MMISARQLQARSASGTNRKDGNKEGEERMDQRREAQLRQEINRLTRELEHTRSLLPNESSKEEVRNTLEGMLAKIDAVQIDAVKTDLESLKASTATSIKCLQATVDDKVGAIAARVDANQISEAERTGANEALSEKFASFESQLSGVCDRMAEAANAAAEAANATAEECTMQSELRAKRHETEIAEMMQEKIAKIEEEKKTIKKNRELINRILSRIGDEISPEVKSLRKEVNTMSELFAAGLVGVGGD